MKWSEERLSLLEKRGGYYLRGEVMTRIEVFSDAAFAFAVTLLVISLDTIPSNYEGLLQALRRVPSFAASFAILVVIWLAHRRWSQRFGLDDSLCTLLTLTQVFVVLVYVYPLKLLMDLTFYALAPGWFPTDFQVGDVREVAGLVVVFGIGFAIIAAIQWGLYRRAASQREMLLLSQLERLRITEELLIWTVLFSAGVVAAFLAWLFRTSIGYLAGTVFGLIPVILPLVTLKVRRAIHAHT